MRKVLWSVAFWGSFVTAAELEKFEFSCKSFDIKEEPAISTLPPELGAGIEAIFEGLSLRYDDDEGKCLPSMRSYIVGYVDSKEMRVLAFLNGFSPEMKIVEIDGVSYLSVIYHSGAHSTYVNFYRFVRGSEISLINESEISTDLGKLEVSDGKVIVQATKALPGGATGYVTREYEVKGGLLRMTKEELLP